MLTAVVSDLHLGSGSKRDVLRLPEARERLAQRLAEADRVVLLGDILELRESPLAGVLRAAAPVVEVLASVTAGRELVVVPGNHDHQFAAPWLERLRLEGREGDLGVEQLVEPEDAGVAGWLKTSLADTEVKLAYPGLWLRPDVYATHGHYLDVHLTMPRLESLAAGLVARFVHGRDGSYRAAADYEMVLSPLYSLLYGMAQGSGGGSAVERGSSLGREVWRSVNHGGGRVRHFLAARVAIPSAVAAINLAGFGPFRSDLTAVELRRSGLRAMGEVVRGLGIEAAHVVFGHTHRRGPLEGDEVGEWRTPVGARLWNTGSWFHEPALLGRNRDSSPYWPGGCLLVRDEGPPESVNLLEDVDLVAALPRRR